MLASGPTDGGNGKILQKIIINKNSVWLDSEIMLDHGVFTNCGKILSYPLCKPGVVSSIPGFSSLSDETLNRGPVSV